MKTTKLLALALLSCCLQIIPVYSDSQSLLDAWEKINTNYASDIQQSNNIYFKIKEEQFALNELRTIVERHLRAKNAETLANALNANNAISDEKIREIMENITNTYDKQLADNIFAQALDEIVTISELPQLPDILWRIYQQNNLESFEVMLRLQIQLYNSFSDRHRSDENKFLHNFAYRLFKITKENLYDSVNLSLKSSVQTIVDKLPNNLKYLYFRPHFCLLNVKYENYIYTAIEAKVDPLSRYIWLWFNNKSMDDTGYIEAEVSESSSNNEKQLKVVLKGKKYQMYYYIMPSTKKIAGWDTVGTPSNYIWDLELLDNSRVAFSQNEYIMCAVESHDSERRNVGGRIKGEVSSESPECQWHLGECAFK